MGASRPPRAAPAQAGAPRLPRRRRPRMGLVSLFSVFAVLELMPELKSQP